MLSLISALIGVVAFIVMTLTLIPFLGWANWLFVPLVLLGALIGQFAAGKGARNFCLIVAGLGIFRLWIGGGFI